GSIGSGAPGTIGRPGSGRTCADGGQQSRLGPRAARAATTGDRRIVAEVLDVAGMAFAHHRHTRGARVASMSPVDRRLRMARFTSVLCPTDLSEASFRAIGYAVAWAESSGATLTVLHVVPTFEPLPVPPAELDGSVQVVYPTSRDEVLEALRRIAGEAGADSTKTEVRAAAGDAWKTIVEQATALDA